MPPAGLQQTEMDEEALLELEIQQDLDMINLDNDQFVGDNEAEINNNDILEEVENGTDGDAPFSLEGEVRHSRIGWGWEGSIGELH